MFKQFQTPADLPFMLFVMSRSTSALSNWPDIASGVALSVAARRVSDHVGSD